MKAAAEWLYNTVFKEEPIQPRPPRSTGRAPAVIRAARSLETGVHQSWQSREALFMKQGKLLANYEDDYGDCGSVTCYYPTYQALTDRQLRSYFSWRTKLRRGDVRKTALSFAFLYIYELINQIGVTDPMDGYHRLEHFRDAYSQADVSILPYLRRWMPDYVVYYGLDAELLSDTSQVVQDRCVAVLEHVREQEPAKIIWAVKQLSKWPGRSKFYGAYREDMDQVIVRVLRQMSAHYAARCKKTMVDQYFGSMGQSQVRLFDAAVFCNPLKRRSYEYAVDEQRVYDCKNGIWSVRARTSPPGSGGKLDGLLKTIDSVMRREFDYPHPVKPELETKWILQLIQEEARGLLAQKKAAEEKKITIDYTQLAQIRRDAAATQEKLAVEEDADLPSRPAPWALEQEQLTLAIQPDADLREEPAPPEREQARPTPPEAPREPEQMRLFPAVQPDAAGECPLDPAEHRLLQCLLYGGGTGWVQSEGHLLSVLVDGINEKLYDTFADCVLDDTPQVIEDYTDDLKEMVRP